MATDSIKTLHVKILNLVANGTLEEYRHQSAVDLADTLQKLKDLASTAVARSLSKIHVDERKVVDRIVKLRQQENAKNNANLKKKAAIEAKLRTRIVDQACDQVKSLLTNIAANKTNTSLAVNNGKAAMTIIIASQLTTEELANRIIATLMIHMNPYLAATNMSAPNTTASQAPAYAPDNEDKSAFEVGLIFRRNGKVMSNHAEVLGRLLKHLTQNI